MPQLHSHRMQAVWLPGLVAHGPPPSGFTRRIHYGREVVKQADGGSGHDLVLTWSSHLTATFPR